MDHLNRDLAPISDAGWSQIEHEARTRLVTQLAARKLVDVKGPHGWEYSATELGRVKEVSSPAEGLSVTQRRVQRVIELCSEFQLARRELDDAARGATDLELPELEHAVRQIALGENVLVFHGYAAAGMPGITECSSLPPVTLDNDIEQYPRAVARAIEQLRSSGIDGPYGLAIGPSTYTSIVETAEHGGHLLFDHLHEILGGPLVWAPGVASGIVLSLRGGDFVLDLGEDLSIGYRSSDADVVHLYLEESFSFRVVEPQAAISLSQE
jgi:uncharacterized linocin/CFP29 family protein